MALDYRDEEEVAALRAEVAKLRDRAWSAEHRAEEKVALRRELEELLGMTPGRPASDEVFAEGVARLRELVAEVGRLKALCREAAECAVAAYATAALSCSSGDDLARLADIERRLRAAGGE